jgi:hypothetical protein
MSKENPMLQTLIWTREDMAVAQDWELERGNEGALIWTDLGPEMARMVCESPEVLGELLGVLNRVGAFAEGAWAGAQTYALVRIGTDTGSWARVGVALWAWSKAGAGAGEKEVALARVYEGESCA